MKNEGERHEEAVREKPPKWIFKTNNHNNRRSKAGREVRQAASCCVINYYD